MPRTMPRHTRRRFIASSAGALSATSVRLRAQSRTARPLLLHYAEPASQWVEALPLGNGRLGAMVFGNPRDERIQFNEDTLWSGHPHAWNNPEALSVLPQVRKAVLEEADYTKADQLCRKMQGPFNESYQPLADLLLRSPDARSVTEYRRELDLDTAIATASWKAGPDTIRREVFISAPDQVIVVRTTVSGPGTLSTAVALQILLRQWPLSQMVKTDYCWRAKRPRTSTRTTTRRASCCLR